MPNPTNFFRTCIVSLLFIAGLAACQSAPAELEPAASATTADIPPTTIPTDIPPTATLEESLSKAIESPEKPFIISDMGDNPTAGGAGDVTWTINELLNREEFKNENGPKLIYASIPGPKVV